MIIIELILFIVLSGLIIAGILNKYWLIALAFILLDFGVTALIKRKKRKKLPHVDESFFMDGAQFERYVAQIYEALGYKVQIVGGSGDQGIDIIAKKFFCKIGIQAKCYSKPVSNKAVMEAVAGKKYYRLKKAAVVTNSIFTPSAIKLAKKCRIKLIDKKELAAVVRRLNGK